MIKKCGVDYSVGHKDACGQTFDDAERMTLCPHPLLQAPDWREQVNAWDNSGDTCSVCDGTGELRVSADSFLGGFPFQCYVCHGSGKKPSAANEPICARCRKTASALFDQDFLNGYYAEENYDYAEEVGYQTDITPAQHARDDGTYNTTTNTFCCDDCYIAIGMPTTRYGWKAPAVIPMGQPTVTATNAGLRVVVVPVDGPPRIESVENNLEAFQGLVDGYIEIFRLGNGLVCVLNEEGMHYYPKWGTISLVGDELSRTESIHGQFVVCREVMTPEGAEFASLTESEAFQIVVAFKSRSVILA